MTGHFSLCADRAYAVPLAVTLASLALRHGPGEVSVIHDGFDTSLRRRIAGDAASVLAIEWIDLPQQTLADLHVPSYLSAATAGRLVLSELLPERERTIYLDSDCLCLDHLGELWTTPLLTGVIGAVRDGLTPFAAGPLGTDWWGLGLPSDSAYFNAGVLLMDLGGMRELDLGGQACELMRTQALRWADQCALNIVAHDHWHEIARRWNVQTADVTGRSLTWALWPELTADAVEQPAILHFTERDKPWHRDSMHPARDLWRDMQQATAWPRWSSESRTPWQRLKSRLAVAAVRPKGSVHHPAKELHDIRKR